MESPNSQLFQVHLLEYEKLKDEQVHRIAFRDNMIFVLLGSVGAVASFALSDAQNIYALLVIPWICIVLGWTYIVNDRAISAIGLYLRESLSGKIKNLLAANSSPTELLGWEGAHRGDVRRRQRKTIQLWLDLLTFCASGLVAILWLWLALPRLSWFVVILMMVESLLLLALAHQFWIHSDRKLETPA